MIYMWYGAYEINYVIARKKIILVYSGESHLIRYKISSIYELKRKWNQIEKDNDNNNCYFIKLFDLNNKQNYIIDDSFFFFICIDKK